MAKPPAKKRQLQKAAGTEREAVNKWFRYIKRRWDEHPLYDHWVAIQEEELHGEFSNDVLWFEAISQYESGNKEPLKQRLAAGKPISRWMRLRVDYVLRSELKRGRGRPPTPLHQQSILDTWLDYISDHVTHLMRTEKLSLKIATERVAVFWSWEPHTLVKALMSYRGVHRGSARRHKSKVREARQAIRSKK